MSWPIRFLDHPPLYPAKPESPHYDGTIDFTQFAIGDMAFYHYQGVPCMDRAHLDRLNLTQHYFSHNAGRAPLVLALPDAARTPGGKLYFLVDGQCYSGKCSKCNEGRRKCKCGDAYAPKGYYDGWTVSGAPAAITVHPSVDFDDYDEPIVKHYHGFIKDGVIGDG